MLNSESQKPAAYKFISLEKSGIRLYFTKEENVRYYFARVKKCKCQYKNVQKWQNKNVQLFKTNMIF